LRIQNSERRSPLLHSPPMRILAGDIGGTKTRLGIFEVDGTGCRMVEEGSYPSRDHSGLGEIVADFVGPGGRECQAACFGIAGPVTGRRMCTTNLPWVVDADELEVGSGIPAVALLNDLEATGWGVGALAASQIVVLNPGRTEAVGNGAVIAAGTGLGEGGIYWNGSEARPFACEGGHASFSPTDELGDRLLGFLRRIHGHVSWERVLSGPGLADLFRFMVSEAGETEPEWFFEADRAGDPVPALSEAALEGRCEISVRTLELFVRLYGEEAGNLALKIMATGGVWVGGGIAPRILPVLEGGAFMGGFLAKGRMRPLLEEMPVRVVLDDRAALLGAARFAALIASSR
jgi:glucokinase